eukprot:g7041.t1
MLARIKALKAEEDAKAKDSVKIIPTSVATVPKGNNKTKVTPIKAAGATVTPTNPLLSKLKKAKTPAKPKPVRRRRKQGALGRCIRGWKRYCNKHGKGYAITCAQMTVFLSTLIVAYFALSSRSGCKVTDTIIEASSDGIGDGYIRCLGSYGGYFMCKDGDDANWKCIRRYNFCIPHSWSIGFFKDKDCVDFDDSVSPSRVQAARSPHVYNSNFSRSDGTFIRIENNMYFPQLGPLESLTIPKKLETGLSANEAGTPTPVPISYLTHDYFFGSYTFALLVGNNPNYQFFSIPLLQCREISYKLDDETVYKNYVYIDSWCEEGEILEEVHQRAEPPTELYIEIPKDNGNTL